MKVMGEEKYSWTLFQEENTYFLSVLCGSVAQYTVDLALNPTESERVKLEGINGAAALAKEVQFKPASFLSRNIRSFESVPGVEQASQQWRQKHAAP